MSGNELGSKSYSINTEEVRFCDAARADKVVPVLLTFPAAAGTFPLIVFSHGAGGDRQAYRYLAEYWASHGYFVAQPSHDDSIGWNREQRKPFSFIRMLRTIGDDRTAWLDRVKDVSFVIDSLKDVKGSPPYSGRIDFDEVGVAGHSYGAYTSLLIAGAQPPAHEGVSSANQRDPRVKAIIAISPQGLRGEKQHSLGFDSSKDFAGLNLPVLFVTGDRDVSAWNDARQRLDAFKYAPSGDKYAVTIFGANHMTFVGLTKDQRYGKVGRPLWSGLPEAYGNEHDQLALVENITTDFWNHYLGHRRAGASELSEKLKDEIGKSAVFQSR